MLTVLTLSPTFQNHTERVSVKVHTTKTTVAVLAMRAVRGSCPPPWASRANVRPRTRSPRNRIPEDQAAAPGTGGPSPGIQYTVPTAVRCPSRSLRQQLRPWWRLGQQLSRACLPLARAHLLPLMKPKTRGNSQADGEPHPPAPLPKWHNEWISVCSSPPSLTQLGEGHSAQAQHPEHRLQRQAF